MTIGNEIENRQFIQTTTGALFLGKLAIAALLLFSPALVLPGKDIFDALVNVLKPDVIWHFSLSIYTASWFAGLLFDVVIQNKALVKLTQTGWRWHTYIVFILFMISAGLLIVNWIKITHLKTFSVMLLVFVIMDHSCWLYIRKMTIESYVRSKTTLVSSRNWYNLVWLEIIWDQIQGLWKLWRLIVPGLILPLLITLAFSIDAQEHALRYLKPFLPAMSDHAIISALAASLVFFFVVGMEGWHWAIRARTTLYRVILNKITKEFSLRRRFGVAHPAQ